MWRKREIGERERERERKCERESEREKWGVSIHLHVFHCRRLFAGSTISKKKPQKQKKMVDFFSLISPWTSEL
jgi:hypothetical protein